MITTRQPITSRASFSFYVGPSKPALIRQCSDHADAVTVKGRKGPSAVLPLRSAGFEAAVLFDGENWRETSEPLDASAWIRQQQQADADQLLTPGRLVRWEQQVNPELLRSAADEIAIAEAHGADALLAIDARWLARDIASLMEALSKRDCGLALVLVHRDDPLSRPEAVDGLKNLASSIPGIRVLRSDHGALGAVAFGASHAAMGLSTTNRHGTTRDRPGKRNFDPSPRVFSLMFADWFTASKIAGWALVDDKPLVCHLPCCRGQKIDRFFDEDTWAEVPSHNMASLAWLADHVINAPVEERRRIFLEYCRVAAERYAQVGDRGPGPPKAQLTNWCFS